MGATFKIRVRTEGTSNRKAYVGKDGKKIRSIMIGALETRVLDLTGKMIVRSGLEASERTLWLNAIFFQRLVSRTPRDESYSYRDKEGHIHYHKDDKDYIQDYWTAKYWNYEGITAKYLRENCGCTFETINNKNEIKIIYQEFRNRFFGKEGSTGRKNKESGKTTLKGVRIFCDYPKDKQHELRYHLLEYGGYVGDGIIKEGDKNYHGVIGGRSVQAPGGMTALTEAEFAAGNFSVSNADLIKYLGKITKVKSYESLKKLLKGKVKLSKADVAKIMELYGV